MKKYCFLICLFFSSIASIFAAVLAEIPFYLDEDKQRMIIYAELAGIPGYYIFDTGAPVSIISASKKQQAVLRIAKENVTIDMPYFAVEETTTVYVHQKPILSGTPIYGEYLLVCTDLVSKKLGKFYTGVIGFDMFQDKIVEISMTDFKIRICDSVPQGYTSYTPFTIQPSTHAPLITGSIDGKPISFTIDTGSYSSILIPHSIENYAEDTTVRCIKTPNHNEYLVKKNDVQVFDIALKDKIFLVDRRNIKNCGNIGIKFLKYWNIVLDTRSSMQHLYYRRNQPLISYDLLYQSGNHAECGIIGTVYDDQGYVITGIIENSAAWNAGCRPGSIMLEINGMPLTAYSINDTKKVYGQACPFELTFRNGNDVPQSVLIVPRPLYDTQ